MFRQFGEHCARNQIRVLLIDCLVMTSLFYPSLAVYLRSPTPRDGHVAWRGQGEWADRDWTVLRALEGMGGVKASGRSVYLPDANVDDLARLGHVDMASRYVFDTPYIIYILYLALFSGLGHQLSNASKVHSRFGLAFTGVTQLCCSTVMAFSILALVGWKGDLPTYVLPFVIVVVGAENMSTLTRAVFSVPFTLPVPARIGVALSKVGTTISITSLSDLGLLAGVWVLVDNAPIREFCVFAAVLIVTDWFMLHTFFLTVLSIDAQRLELADVLGDGRATPEQDPPSSWPRILSARTAKGILCCVPWLYEWTERRQLARAYILVLPDKGPTEWLRPALFILKIGVLPQALTAALLYALLLYLLKDAELLDAQRNKGRVHDSPRLRIEMLPCAAAADVEVIRVQGERVVTIAGGIARWEGGSAPAIDVAVGDGVVATATEDEVTVWPEGKGYEVESVGLAFRQHDPFSSWSLLVAHPDGVDVLGEERRRVIDGRAMYHLVGDMVLAEGEELAVWVEEVGWKRTELQSSRPDSVAATAAFRLDRGEWGTVIAVGWYSGLVEIFDVSGPLLTTVRHPTPRSIHFRAGESRCPTCGSVQDGFDLVTCALHTTFVDRIHPHAIRCRHGTPNASPRRSPSALPTEFPLSSHGTRRLSALHDPQGDWWELDVTPLGSIPSVNGGAGVVGDTLVVVHKSGRGVDDAQWCVKLVDLPSWDGSSVVETRLPVGSDGGMAYVRVESVVVAGRKVLAGFGNRLGVIELLGKRKVVKVDVPPTPIQPVQSGLLAPPKR